MEPRADGSFRYFQRTGDLSVGQAGEMLEHEHGAMLEGELAEPAVELITIRHTAGVVRRNGPLG
jgi:hypothetical protein